MTAFDAMLALAAAALVGAVAFIVNRRPPSSSGGDSGPVGGLWGLLNGDEGASPFLPQPDPGPSSANASAYDVIPLLSGPRGIRNRNPGNVKISTSAWTGKIPVTQNTDGTFEQFTDPKYGIRVIAKLLLKYQRDKSKTTVRALIGEPGGWAPTISDKNPSTYATTVARELGISETAYVDLSAPNGLLERMVIAIIRFENGQMPYPSSLISQGVALAR